MTVKADNLSGETARAVPNRLPDFEAIFQQHWGRVYGVLFRLLNDRDQAEELAIEVFWRLHRQAPRHDDEHALAGWLYRVATNLGFNTLRASKRRERYEQAAGEQALASAGSDPADEAERSDERERVRRVLAQMNNRSAQLLILRHSGLSYAELAAVLGVAPGSIGTLLARAEQEFEKQYRAMEGER
ncbi:MAG TPA: sigma-70 family RNA polymerase sigma factor [Ardenticatenaceae bacterium]